MTSPLIKSRRNWQLRGPVRRLRSEFAVWDSLQHQWGATKRWDVVEFLESGEVVDSESHQSNGSVAHSTYQYDDKGRLAVLIFRLNGVQSQTTVFRYDEAGRLVRTSAIDSIGEEKASETFSYEADGHNSKMQYVPTNIGAPSFFGVEGAESYYSAQEVSAIQTIYDDRNQPREALFLDESGGIRLRVLLTRDNQGRLVKEESRGGDESPYSLTLQKLPPEERAATEAALSQIVGPDQTMWGAAYRYDEQGRQVERCQLFAGRIHERTTREFDKYGNPVRETIEQESSTSPLSDLQTAESQPVRQETQYSYKYDEFGNWTERIVSYRVEGQPDFHFSNIERREISYYG